MSSTQLDSHTGLPVSAGSRAFSPQSKAVKGERQLSGTIECLFRNWLGTLASTSVSMSLSGSLGQKGMSNWVLRASSSWASEMDFCCRRISPRWPPFSPLIRSAAETQALAESVADAQGVHVVPAFAGLGAPHWDMYARGGILGITRGTSRAHIVRAALESIAFQTQDLTEAVEAATGLKFAELRVDGGACRNDFLMQFQADLLGCPVDRSRYLESTGMGAAFLAGLAVGFWKSSAEIAALRTSEKTFMPGIDRESRRRLQRGWADAVERVKSRR